MIAIRAANEGDRAALWAVLEPTIRSGEFYALPRDMSEDHAIGYWTGEDRGAFVAVEDSRLVGTYYLRANQLGGGDHVANCGYVVAADCHGRGVAGLMCEHSLNEARRRGFTAIQFNLVVSTNNRAIALWQRFGFEIVGRLPQAFDHPRFGLVDALVMYRLL